MRGRTALPRNSFPSSSVSNVVVLTPWEQLSWQEISNAPLGSMWAKSSPFRKVFLTFTMLVDGMKKPGVSCPALAPPHSVLA